MLVDLDAWGIHGPVMLAGFSGGICAVGILEQKAKLWRTVTTVLISTLVANYLSAVATGYIFGHSSAPAPAELASAFIVGIGGPWIVRAIATKIGNWNPDEGGNEGAPK